MEIKIIIGVATFTVLFGLLLTYFRLKIKFESRLDVVETQISSFEYYINELKSANAIQNESLSEKETQLQAWQLEHQQVSQQLEHRIKVQQENIHSLKDQLTQLQQQQPEDRLYTRAQKMVTLGADVDEIVKECGLPVAEAEILISMYKRKI